MRMTTVPVTEALPPYHHAHEIISGLVPLAGMTPTFVEPAAREADIRDIPLLSYVVARLSGEQDVTAVPVFLARAFVHSWMHLADKEVNYESVLSATAGIYARGLLSEQGELPTRLLVAPPASCHGGMRVRPLFDDPEAAERESFERTGVYPILSVIGIRTELLERERWLASNVYRAFEVSRRRYFSRLQDIRGSRAPIPSVAAHLRELMNTVEPQLWPNGLASNRVTLEAFLRFAAHQGAISAAPAEVDGLFAPVEPFVDFTDGI